MKSDHTRYQWSILSQLKFGILPLKIETDIYQVISPDRHICKLCSLPVHLPKPNFCSRLCLYVLRKLKFESELIKCWWQIFSWLQSNVWRPNIENMGKFIECPYKLNRCKACKRILNLWYEDGITTCRQIYLPHFTTRWSCVSKPHDDVIKWKHFPRYWPFVRGIHRPPVNSPHKGQWRGALMFTLICARINGWVNNR